MPVFPLGTRLEDEIDFLTSAVHVSPFSKHVLVYYIPGNPGLIEYYRNFLQFLTRNLSKDEASRQHQTQFHIHGESLAGFALLSSTASAQQAPHSLDDIKQRLIQSIDHKAKEIIDSHDLKVARLPVILIGHSIGAWLALESIVASKHKDSLSPQDDRTLFLRNVHILGGALLFPTIVDIAKSPNGLRAAWFLRLPYTASILSIIAAIQLLFFPLALFVWLVQLFTGMPYHSALVTSSWLKSRGGLRQTLCMARDEMLQVCDDSWSDEIWGVQSTTLSSKEAKALAKEAAMSHSRLYLLFGANDEWVANTTRDQIMSKRAKTTAIGDELKPVMEIDHTGLKHAFALHDEGARIVADKASAWILDVVHSP